MHCCWECKLGQPLWQAVWTILEKLEVELPYDPAISLLVISPNVHQQTQMDGADVVFICNGILLSRKKKRVKSCHLQQYGGIQVKDKYDKYDFTYMHNLKSRTN